MHIVGTHLNYLDKFIIAYVVGTHLLVKVIQMSTHKICYYKEVDDITQTAIWTTKLLDCALIGADAVIRSNMVLRLNTVNEHDCIYIYG